jgi:excisionase family DNA binding protein
MTGAADDRRVDPALEQLLDIGGLAARLGATSRFVRRLVEERRVPYLKIGRLVRFDPAAVDSWIGSTKVDPHGGWQPSGRKRGR